MEDQNEKFLEEAEINLKKDEFLKSEEEVSKEIFLPSIKDSKLWKIKVIPGKERELVFKITNKLI